MKLTRILTASVIALSAVALSACSAPSSSEPANTPIGGDVITPVSVEANDLQGETVDLIVGQVLNINTGDLATDSYTGVVDDTAVAEFTPGKSDAGAELNPGVTAVGVGDTSVTMKNAQGGIQPITFTVVVTEK